MTAMDRPAFGQPEWYDREIDWIAAHDPFVSRDRCWRLVDARNEVARRYGKPERTVPLPVSWYLMVEHAEAIRRVLLGCYRPGWHWGDP